VQCVSLNFEVLDVISLVKDLLKVAVLYNTCVTKCCKLYVVLNDVQCCRKEKLEAEGKAGAERFEEVCFMFSVNNSVNLFDVYIFFDCLIISCVWYTVCR